MLGPQLGSPSTAYQEIRALSFHDPSEKIRKKNFCLIFIYKCMGPKVPPLDPLLSSRPQ